MKISTLIATAFLTLAAISPAAWAVSGNPPASLITAGGTSGYPDAIRFSTTDAPTVYYCVSSEDPAGNDVSGMIASALELFSYNIGANMNASWQSGSNPSWSNPSDCPSNYVYGVKLTSTIASPQNSQALTMKLAGSLEPSCVEFTLQGQGSTVFGASINDSGISTYISSLATSEYLGGAISYTSGGSNSGDCASTDTYVSNISVH